MRGCLPLNFQAIGPNIGAAAALDLALLSKHIGMVLGVIHGALVCRSERMSASTRLLVNRSPPRCHGKFDVNLELPISGFRPGDRGINYMSSHADEIEVWLVPLPSTVMYLPYRISVPTAFGSGSAEMLSFQVEP